MEQNQFYTSTQNSKGNLLLLGSLLVAIFAGWLITKGIATGILLSLMPFVIGFVILFFLQPRAGFIVFVVYCFAVPGLGRHIEGPQFGLGQDGMLLLAWLGIIFNRSNRFRYRHLKNDLVWLAIVWFIITVLQIGNPERPSLIGWFYEMRSATLYWVLSVPLAFMVFNKKSDIDLFLNIIIIISVAGALYGVKQLFIGTNAAENRWLEAGAKKTHILFKKLRVFSFYTEAGQFGASQAQIAILAIILAVGPHTKLKKMLYLAAGLICFYGMLISGTRGALFAFVGGGFLFLALSGKLKILIIGAMLGMGFFGVLKYTSIGSGNEQIVRLRSSLDPNDPSLMTRLNNQKVLSSYLSTRPFGAGVGTLGMWGMLYNRGGAISSIPPDSLYVKVWAMYGIIGFIIWFGIMLYITGKASGIIWKTRDPVLRNKLTALLGGATGILLCSYGNEVLNQMPSSIIVYVSWALIWMSPRWDTLQHASSSEEQKCAVLAN
ncbi:MAG: hypothetical protein LH478_05780 [Chitinophagaceae bacterium]|nr:hypothetical protein [Chitinophagaceae bacterium]